MSSPGQKPLQTPRTAVITVSYGSGEVLEEFLGTLRAHHGPDQVVVVVDNNPDAQGVQSIASRFGASYVPLPSNPGYGAGMNAGVQSLSGDFDAYFFCNPDVAFLEPVIDRLAKSLLQDPDAGSIGPRVLNDDGSVYPSARDIPSLGTGVGHALLSKVWPTNPWTRAYQKSKDSATRRAAGSLSGAAVMVKREVFDQIGGWDEAYFMHFEDIDLGYRIGLAGLLNIFEPAATIHHSGAHSTKRHAALVEQAMTDSAVRFMGKRYAGFWNGPLRLALTLGLRLRGALKLASIRRSESRA